MVQSTKKTLIKICGITNCSDAAGTAKLGADILGIVLSTDSPRKISYEKAKEITDRIRSGFGRKIGLAGVFVNEPIEKVLELKRFLDLDLIQLSGDENIDFMWKLKKATPGTKIIKAVRIRADAAVHMGEIKNLKAACDYILLDSYREGVFGGTGMTLNWSHLKNFNSCPGLRVILSGGLNGQNIREAITVAEPFGVDASSGLEEHPGKKDLEKVKEFILTIRNMEKTEMKKIKGKEYMGQTEKRGYFGEFGGRYVPEILIAALEELEKNYFIFKDNRDFQKDLAYYLSCYAGRPTPLYYAQRLTEHLGGAKIYLKREDLCHLGAHKINNTIGQALLAQRMGKKCIIAETGAGQHGVATAAVAALFGMECRVFMGSIDMKRQYPNVYRMRLMGAEVAEVTSGSRTLKDACNEALRYWASNVDDIYYLLGSVVGPHPYPLMVRDFQKIIGIEARRQIGELEGRLPDHIIACVGGGSNSIGIFYPFLDVSGRVKLTGVEAAGKGLETGEHCATLSSGKRGVFQGSLSFVLQDDYGQIKETYSISAGLDYPGVGPEHAYLKEKGLAEYVSATDEQALEAFRLLSRFEGIIPAYESAHALAQAMKIAPGLGREKIILVNLSGRGDKDLENE